MTAAELWKRYQPKLAAAKEKDREDASAALMRNPVLIGGQWIKPLSIESLIFLQAAGHPLFKEGEIGAEDVLSFLWVTSVGFKPMCKWRYRLFKLRFLFADQEKMKVDVVEWLHHEFGTPDESKSDGEVHAPPHNWVTGLIDLLASEYGWSENEIMEMPIKRAFGYSKAIIQRKTAGEQQVRWAKETDKVRGQYLKELELLREAGELEEEDLSGRK
jgi:hypothetical protein